MHYNHKAIEQKWQKYWAENQTFKAEKGSEKEKYYVLDMFPYPSGAGLHVGHPLGYIASDIYARYKRHQGYNVLHPQGYDSFGLPAEQYAIQTGQHPAITTKENIARYREQLDNIGFSFDWSREVRTSNPEYYKWTQWIFVQLFDSWYDKNEDKARSIASLIAKFEKEGNTSINAVCDEDIPTFTAEQWGNYTEKEQEQFLLHYRLTYLAETEVNWCSKLGTVLANDEIVNGVSERGGYPVTRKKMTQWSMRISAYAERLLQGLTGIDWTESLKESQRNWIGKSVGAHVTFNVFDAVSGTAAQGRYDKDGTRLSEYTISVFTTRPDTIFGVTFMTLAPEHELVQKITIPEQKEAVQAYITATAKRSERERMADVKTISGVFTGAYAEHPFTKEPVPIWIGDYVLAGYGTGAVMAVPCGDQRDYDFANYFEIPITNIFEGIDISEEAYGDKNNVTIANSDFLNGLGYKKAAYVAIKTLENQGQGYGKTNYRLRDAVFSRQRYWGEPFPVYYVNGMPKMIDKEHLPITLPQVEKYLPTETGEPPLGRADNWAWDSENAMVVSNDRIDHKMIFPLELNTMPGWAGSSWYLFRYMDAHNEQEFASAEALDYWQNVDLYIGGSEHATGHLLYSRFWTKFLKDRGHLSVDEPFKKLINQGMILGEGAFAYRIVENNSSKSPSNSIFVPSNWYYQENFEEFQNEKLNTIIKKFPDHFSDTVDCGDLLFFPTRIDISRVNKSNELDIGAFRSETAHSNALFLDENCDETKNYIVRREVEKMSKSKYNVVNPDEICEQYGADTLRLYEMFLGPLEQAKPWNTAGITGVSSFLKKFWKLYHTGKEGAFMVTDTPIAEVTEGAKILHKTIKKVQEDIENFSFNTSVSTFMICANELTAQKCTSRVILEPLLVLLSPYAPHIAEELWSLLGHSNSITTAPFPEFDEKYLVESTKEYPISFNGKMRFKMELPLDLSKDEIEAAVMAHEKTKQQLDGRIPKKIIIVPGKIVNLVG